MADRPSRPSRPLPRLLRAFISRLSGPVRSVGRTRRPPPNWASLRLPLRPTTSSQPILFQPERGVGQNDIFSPAACHTRRPSRGDEVFASRRVDPYRERTLDASDVRSRPRLRVAAPRHPSSRGNFLLFLTDGRSFPRARSARRPHAAHGEARASRVRPRSVDEPRRGGERGRRRDGRARHQRVHQAQGPEAVLGVRAVGSTAILRG